MGMRMLAQGWLVLELTDSPFWVGFIAGLQGLGLVSFGVFGGTLVDRLDRRKVLAAVHLSGGTAALVIGLLVLTSNIALWHMVIVALLQGVLMAIQLPASNSLVYQTVGPQRLLNAMAARLLAMNLTRVIGSLIAGALITAYGVGACYVFAAGSTYTGLALVLFIKGEFGAPAGREPFWRAVGEGIRYAWSNSGVRTLLFFSVLMEGLGFSHFVMMPVMARDVLEVGATGLGYLSAASGAGAMLSTIAVAGLGDFRNKSGLLVAMAACSGLILVLFAFSPWFVVSLIAVAAVGASLMAYDVTMGTMLQILATDALRGRVLGLYGLTFGFTPVGGFVAGTIATIASAPVALGLFGVSIVAYVARMARPILRLRPTQESVQAPD